MNQGERVSGRYKIIKQIGAGGMANVYLATDLILEREVAVKMMSLDFQNDKDSLRRFQREALSTTELTHPNIVNVYDVGEGEQPYIVMEHVDGMDLKEYIHENHPIPYKKAIDIMEQILSGISYAHKNDVIHRDIKPHNILIDQEGNVKITDFGIAVALSQNSITQTNSLLGSVQYISPEQARGNIVTKQSDIYSLGIVLYELLTGTVPFEGESAVSIALKHFQSPIPSLREFDSRLPQPLENVVLKATAKEPRHRYATVDEMKADLLTALSPSRRNEPKFMPPAEDEEDTIVLDANAIKEEENQKVTAAVNDETIQVSDENGNSESNKSPKKKRRWLWLLIPLILVGVFLAFILQRPAEVIIPEELIGMTEDEAIEYLEEISLAVGEIHEQPNDEYEEGLIFRVNPNTGATVLEGAEIDLYVSQGEEPFVLEDYTDQNFDEVRAILDEAGFTVESETDTSEEVSEGDIISQDIESGEEVIPSETTITFTVSEGRPSFRMADLIEYSRKGVQDYATRWNLNLTVEEAPSEDVPAGLVMAQEPAEGAPLYAGDHISVVFSTGPEEVQTTTFVREITIPYEENQSDSEGEENEDEVEREPDEIQIFIDDFEHTYDEPARELSITEETTIEQIFIVEEGETARYKVTRNGEDLFEETVRP